MASAETIEHAAQDATAEGSTATENGATDATMGDLPVESVIVGEDGHVTLEDKLVETTSHTTADPHAPKMPQLNPEFFHSQIFWLFVSFIFLWVVLSRSVLPRIHTLLENRQSKISHDLDRAEKLGLEAEAAREHYERALVESRSKAQSLMAESAALMEKSSAARHAELSAKLEKQLADAETSILAAKADALAKLKPVAKELTQEIVEKLTGQKLKPADVSGVVDALAKESSRG